MTETKDFSERRVNVKVRHMWAIFVVVVGTTVMLVGGYRDLKAEAAEAKAGVAVIASRIFRLECLIEQMNNYQIYKIKPLVPCPPSPLSN